MTKIEWKIDYNLTDYEEAVAFMEQRNREISEGKANELIWLTQHPPLYTAGISACDSDLLNKEIPTYKTNRGGKHTYHGPGIRIIYVMLNLKNVFKPQNPDVSLFVKMLEDWMIAVLARFGIKGEIREGRVGIWVESNDNEKKIGAIGIKLKKWVSYHGIAININPDLEHFQGIIPCGISEFGVTSLEELGEKIAVPEFDKLVKEEFLKIFKNYSGERSPLDFFES